MDYANMGNVVALKEIIKDYRKNEITISLDERHILKWLFQFDEKTQDVILSETVHILEKYYFGYDAIEMYLERIITYLHKEAGVSYKKEVFRKYGFPNIQKIGDSQNVLHNRLAAIAIKEQVEICEDSSEKKYVYVDDGIYSGNRAKDDIEELIKIIPEGSTVYVFHYLATSSGLQNVKEKLHPLAKKKRIDIIYQSWIKLDNYHKAVLSTAYSEHDTEEYYPNMCLWPEQSVSKSPIVKDFIKQVRETFPGYNFKYRGYPWNTQTGIFTSVDNRRIVEKAFLEKGIYIYQFCNKKQKIYPLGSDGLATFGTGTFCAFEDNISNTCPLVLWWGNIEHKGNVMDNWYPLLPRRTCDHDLIEESAF